MQIVARPAPGAKSKFNTLSKNIKSIGIFMFAAFLLGSCSEQTTGIFYSLAQEVKIAQQDNGLKQEKAHFQDLIMYGSMYVLKGPVLYASTLKSWPPAPDTSMMNYWKKIPIPAGMSASSIATDGTYLYGVFVSNAATGDPVIKRSAFDDTNFESATWEDVNSGLGSELPGNLLSANGTVFLQTYTIVNGSQGNYTLYYYVGAGWTAVNVTLSSDNTSNPFLGAAYCNGAYWLLKANKLYTAANQNGSFVIQATSYENNTVFKGFSNIRVSTLSANRMYISSQDGYVIKYDAGVWSRSAQFSYPFTDVQELTLQNIQGADTHTLLIAATATSGYSVSGNGLYYEQTSGNLDFASLNYSGNTSSTELYSGDIIGLFATSNQQAPLFALAPTYGLWSAVYDSSVGGTDPKLRWVWE